MNRIDFLLFFIYLYKIGYLFVLPIICVIGFFLNLICWLVLLNPSLREKIYFYFTIKVFLGIFLLAFGALTPYVICMDCATYETYSSMVINLVGYKFMRNSMYLFATLIEIIITFDRYFTLRTRAKIFVTKKNKLFLAGCGLFSALVYLPTLFAEKITHSRKYKPDGYTLTATKFGEQKYYYTYLTCVSLISNVLTILILLPFNIMILVKYRKFIKRKNIISKIVISPVRKPRLNLTQSNLSQKKFTKMILVISFLFILSRLGEASVRIFNSFHDVVQLEFFDFYSTVLTIFVEFNTYVIFSSDFFVYYIFNKPFRDCFKRIFLCNRSNFFRSFSN